MTVAFAQFREHFPPHRIIGQTRVRNLEYGFALGDPSSASFQLSKGLQILTKTPEILTLGRMVSIKRSDNVLPWVGFVTQKVVSQADPFARFGCSDPASALIDQARTRKDSSELTGAAGTLFEEAFQEADARNEPPLLMNTEIDGGSPTITITPKAESLLTFLRTMCEGSNWEWEMRYGLTRQDVAMALHFTERIGLDLRNEIVYTESHFNDAEMVQTTEGFVANALVVGGSGAYRDRPAVQANLAGRGDDGVSGTVIGVTVPDVPALMGTRVLNRQTILNEEALQTAAIRVHRAPEYAAERLSLKLVESQIDVKRLGLGCFYTVRFEKFDVGLGYERVIRCVSLRLDESGVIEMVAEVER